MAHPISRTHFEYNGTESAAEPAPNAVVAPAAPEVWEEAEVLRRWRHRGEELWARAVEIGTPIHLAGGRRSTFLFRSQAPAVHLRVNRLTDKHRMALGMMERVEGTDIWVKTLDTGPLLRASYGFRELEDTTAPAPVPPEHDRFQLLTDPLNRAAPVVEAGAGCGLSLLAGAEALSEAEAQMWPGAAAALGTRFAREGGRFLYLPKPPGDSAAHAATPVPIVLLSDAEQWFNRYGLAFALDLGVQRGTLPPLAVCGEGFATREERLSSLRANPEYVDRLLGEDLSYTRSALRAAGFTPGRVVLAGQSLGGLTALFGLTTQRAGEIDAVIAQSPSLWFTPGVTCSPAQMADLRDSWIGRELCSRPPQGVPIHLEVGLREGPSVPAVRHFGEQLTQSGWRARVHTIDGGHDFASWRYGLINLLAEALGS